MHSLLQVWGSHLLSHPSKMSFHGINVMWCFAVPYLVYPGSSGLVSKQTAKRWAQDEFGSRGGADPTRWREVRLKPADVSMTFNRLWISSALRWNIASKGHKYHFWYTCLVYVEAIRIHSNVCSHCLRHPTACAQAPLVTPTNPFSNR